MNKAVKAVLSILVILSIAFEIYASDIGVIKFFPPVSEQTITAITIEYSKKTTKTEPDNTTDVSAARTNISKKSTAASAKNNTVASSVKSTSESTTATKKTAVSAKTKKKQKAASTSVTASTASSKESVVYFTIECKSVLKNAEKLKSGHSAYIPADGYILKNFKQPLKKGDTVFELLKKVCSKNNIELLYRDTVYGAYITGINNLSEFDAGGASGWLYMVNGKYPGITCEAYKLSAGDKIVFSYTC